MDTRRLKKEKTNNKEKQQIVIERKELEKFT